MTEAPGTQIETPDTTSVDTLVHHRLRRKRRVRSLQWMAVQVVLIGVGVFLGLAGEQWRQDRENYRQAMESLQRIRAEIVANREAVNSVKDYHAIKFEELKAFFAADAEARRDLPVRFEGLKAPTFEHTAWDLAVVTGLLAHIDPDLAFQLSGVYSYQLLTTDLGRGVMQAMYLRPPSETDTTFLAAVQLYYGDLIGLEPGLISAYDQLVKQIDSALQQ